MATISEIQTILKNAKNGQFVSLKCEGSDTDINGHVVQLGTEKVDAVKIDDWEEGWPKPAVYPGLCFTAEEDGATMSFSFGNDKFFQTSPTGEDGTWTDYASQTEITFANAGDKMFFKAKTSNETCKNSMFHISDGKIAASGNIQSLLDETCQRMDVPESCYQNMFYGCTSLTSAPELPATTLAIWCYSGLFGYCISLSSAPALPATTLAEYCYDYMFSNCSNLTTAPALPATTLADHCYSNMFVGCTSLTSATELPATELATGCYIQMFDGCTSLASAPDLPAETLAAGCYDNMFQLSQVTSVDMKTSVEGVYNQTTHGKLRTDATVMINYVL